MDKLVLIDGHAILHRAYHAYPPLTTSSGELINAVYGFFSILLTVLNQLKPKYVAVCFDRKEPTFRHKEYKGYKASRPKVDQELIDQIKRVHQVVKALNIPIFEVAGFEADDVLGTLAKQAKINQVLIATGDNDAFQLIDDKIKVLLPGRGKKPSLVVGESEFFKQYNFKPEYLADYKALAGDSSDDIPGVKGIGAKTAKKLVAQFGSIDNIYKSFDQIEDLRNGSKVVKLLKQEKDQALLSKKLATIVTNVPLKFDLQKCLLLDYDKDRAIAVFEKMEFKSLINKLPNRDWQNLNQAEKHQPKLENNNNQKQMELF